MKYRLLLKIKGIAQEECIPRPFENFKSTHLSKLSGKVHKTSQKSAFHHLNHYFELEKKVH